MVCYTVMQKTKSKLQFIKNAFVEVEPGELTDDESDNEDKVSQEKLSLLGKILSVLIVLFNHPLSV